MALGTDNVAKNLGDQPKISTFAVLDLETTNLPAFSNNRVSITELCIYAFEAALLKQDNASKGVKGEDQEMLPTPPRVLHKLNLLFQPSMRVHPEAEQHTGLSNYLLERESKLDRESAQLIISFIKHLPAPVCLVAHNGWGFDFPIVRQALEKLNLEFPPSVTCVDSLRAFLEIDDKRLREESIIIEPVEAEHKDQREEPDPEPCKLDNEIIPHVETETVKEIDWKIRNETTPKRPILTPSQASAKRKQLSDEDDDDSQTPAKRTTQDFRSRRQLFSGLKCAETKRFPPRLKYRLGSLYTSRFNRPAHNAHQAEADVAMLTKLIQHYGIDFLAFAEEQAIPFHQVKPLGSPAQAKR
ncbi:uncharacterized protein [Drosophila kikkawai]|uniref:Exonuclease domain-containing protein n=1 Tax=Drosophila kikkawai TaxID=30033 RepID=A0A6P4IK90_DROKI|nr:uncharacterized protein LOC108075857 [Drosophila kikkawai]